jgi:hypothetical protein
MDQLEMMLSLDQNTISIVQASSDTEIERSKSMKQSQLVQEVYKACFSHDAKKLAELQKEEFRKIAKRRVEGKPFTTRWTLVQL